MVYITTGLIESTDIGMKRSVGSGLATVHTTPLFVSRGFTSPRCLPMASYTETGLLLGAGPPVRPGSTL